MILGDLFHWSHVTSLHITPKKGSQNIREAKNSLGSESQGVLKFIELFTQMFEAQPIEEPRKVIPSNPRQAALVQGLRDAWYAKAALQAGLLQLPRSFQGCAHDRFDRYDRPCLFLWTSQGCPEGEECSWAEPSMVERQDTKTHTGIIVAIWATFVCSTTYQCKSCYIRVNKKSCPPPGRAGLSDFGNEGMYLAVGLQTCTHVHMYLAWVWLCWCVWGLYMVLFVVHVCCEWTLVSSDTWWYVSVVSMKLNCT